MIYSRKLAGYFRRSFLFDIRIECITVCECSNASSLLRMSRECNSKKHVLEICLITLNCSGISKLSWYKAQL